MALIEKIEKVKRLKNVYTVVADGLSYQIYDEFIILHQIKVGKNIDENILEQLNNSSQQKMCLQQCTTYLSASLRTEKEIFDKLKIKGYSEEIINYTIDKMKAYGYIDDQKFATMYINQFQDVKGVNRIKQELLRKGIDKDKIDALCSQIIDQDNMQEVALKLAQKYMKNKTCSYKNKSKLYAHLINKGCLYEDVMTALNCFDWDREQF